MQTQIDLSWYFFIQFYHFVFNKLRIELDNLFSLKKYIFFLILSLLFFKFDRFVVII